MSQANVPPSDPNQSNVPPTSPKPKKKRSKLKLLGLIVGVIVILILLLVLFIPTIASMGAVREAVLKQVNNGVINGRVEIQDWSFGWTSGVHLTGVRVFGDDNAKIVDVGQIDCPISFVKAATGTINIDGTKISNPDVNIIRYPDGTLNVLKLIKPTPPNNNPPGKLPNVTGTVMIENATGTITDEADGVNSAFTANVTAKIPSINDPIEDHVDITTKLSNQDFGKITIDGKAAAINGNMVDVDHVKADQTISLKGVDFAAISPILAALAKHQNNPQLNVKLTGKVDGDITVAVDTPQNVNATVKLAIANLSAGAPGLQGDTVGYKSVSVAVNATVAGDAVKLDLPIDAVPTGGGQDDKIAVHVDASQAAMMQSGAVAQAILDHFLKKTNTAADISGSGKITTSVDIGVAQLLNQVPHLVALNQGTTLSEGRFATTETITLSNHNAQVGAEMHITAVKGSNAGKDVALSDIDGSLSISLAGGNHPALRSPTVSLTSGFLTFKGGGEDVTKTAFDGSLDFGALQKQVAQIIDIDALMQNEQGAHVAMAGTASLHIESNGDLTQEKTADQFATSVKVDSLKISGLGKESIDLPNFTAGVSGTADLDRTQPNPLQDVSGLKIVANSPAIDFDIDAKAKMDGPFGVTLPELAINKGTINLAELQKEFGGAVRFVLKRNDLPTIQNCTVVLAGKGSFENTFSFDQPLSIQVAPTDVTMPDSTGKMQPLHVDALTLTIDGGGSVDAASKTTTIKGLSVRTIVGNQASPDFIALITTDATVTQTDVNASSIVLNRCEGDLPKLQKLLAPAMMVILPPTPPTTQPTAIQQFADQTLQVTGGNLLATMTASAKWQKDGSASLSFSKPLTANLQNISAVQNGKTVATNDNVTATFGADVVNQPSSLKADLTDLSLKVNDAVDIELDPAQKFHATMAGSNLTANGQINFASVKLDNVLPLAQPFLTPDMKNQLSKLASAGVVTGNVKLSPGPNNATSVSLTVDDQGVQVVNHPVDNLNLTAGGNLSADRTSFTDGNVNVASSLGRTVSITNANLRLPGGTGPQPGIFDMLQSADVKIDGIILTRLQTWASFLGAVDTSQMPVTLTAGELSMQAHVQRKGNSTEAQLQSLNVSGVQLTKDKASYKLPSDITMKAMASIDTAPNMPPDAPLMAQIARATVNQLALNLGPIQVGVPSGQTIAVSGLDDMKHLTANGDITVDGNIDQLCSILNVFTGTLYPYIGSFHFEEAISKSPSSPALLVVGGGKVTQFQVHNVAPPGQTLPAGTPAVAFSEPEIDVQNPLMFDPVENSVLIDAAKPVSISLKSTGAASISIVGGVHDLQVARKLADGTAITLDYDLAKVWPIIKPMVPPDQLAKISDLVMSGVHHEVIPASGSYPGNTPGNQAIRTFKSHGALAVGHVSTNGLTVDNLEVFFDLADGKFSISTPKPAQCNGGTIDLSTIVVDLTGDEPMVSMPGVDPQHVHTMLGNISLNAALSKSLMGKFLNNPVFTGANDAKGLVTLYVYKMQTVPLGDLLYVASNKNPGVAEVKYDITGLRVGAPLISQLPGINSSMTAEIKGGDVQLSQGKINEDSTMMFNGNQPMRVWGVVGLAKQDFEPMTASIPLTLMGGLIPGNVRQYMPDRLVVPMTGDVSHPKFELDKVIGQAVADAAKKAAAQQGVNLLNGLLNKH